MHLNRNYWVVSVGILAGVAVGYLYWLQIGCASGTCPITSSPVNSSLYGAMMGGLLFSMFRKEKNNHKNESGENH